MGLSPSREPKASFCVLREISRDREKEKRKKNTSASSMWPERGRERNVNGNGILLIGERHFS